VGAVIPLFVFLHEVADEAEDGLVAGGIKVDYYVSPGTHHEWLTWRRSLKEFVPKLFKK
jgi:enterochelin esterase-like enzyme